MPTSLLAECYTKIWDTLKACPELKPIADAQGFIAWPDAPSVEGLRTGKAAWAALYPAPGGFCHPANQAGPGVQATYTLRYSLGTFDALKYYASKEGVYKALCALPADLGAPGVTGWKIIDSTDEPIQAEAKQGHFGWDAMLKIVVDATL